MNGACECCEIARTRDEARQLHRFGHWHINVQEAHDESRPNLILQVELHRAHLADLSPTEAATLGPVLSFVTERMRMLTGCDRVYVVFMNEAGHVHFFLLPRFDGDEIGNPRALIGKLDKPATCPNGVDLAAHIGREWSTTWANTRS